MLTRAVVLMLTAIMLSTEVPQMDFGTLTVYVYTVSSHVTSVHSTEMAYGLGQGVEVTVVSAQSTSTPSAVRHIVGSEHSMSLLTSKHSSTEQSTYS